MDNILVQKYAKALLKIGVNIQSNEVLLLQSDTETLPLARELTKQAFQYGASDVQVRLNDPYIDHYRNLYASEETLSEVDNWQIQSIDSILSKGNAVQIGARASMPTLNDDINDKNLLASAKANNELRNVVRKYIHKATLKWTGTVWPSLNWAEKVYPELEPLDAYKQLENDLCLMMRIDYDSDPIHNWLNHLDKLAQRAHKLNELNFKYLHMTSGLGTDITIPLVENHIWLSAGEMGATNVNAPYVANMPTEEVFTDPDYRGVKGIAYASFPLYISGKLVKDFWIKFENGKAIDCGAKENEEFLREALFKDEYTRQLGEVALVSKYSPIKKLNRIFYNGLIDENAACHLAFGSSFADCIKGGDKMSQEELYKNGVNHAISHHDFMVGYDDTKVVGVRYNGEEVVIMNYGDFVI